MTFFTSLLVCVRKNFKLFRYSNHVWNEHRTIMNSNKKKKTWKATSVVRAFILFEVWWCVPKKCQYCAKYFSWKLLRMRVLLKQKGKSIFSYLSSNILAPIETCKSRFTKIYSQRIRGIATRLTTHV